MIGSILQVLPFDFKPSAPPAGSYIMYVKSDNTIYLQDSTGVEYAFGTTTAISQLSGEATAIGPGNAVVTLDNNAVIGKVLTGFTPGPNSTVLASDTILQAIEKLQAQISASVGSAVTSLTGDVTGTGPGATATTVASVGGKTAANIAQSVTDTQNATSINTASTIVKRDASGNFAANTITANLTGNVLGNLTGNVTGSASNNVLKAGDTMTGGLTINAAGTSLDVSDDALIGGDLGVTGTITGSNLSGTNTGDVTITDTNSIDLSLAGQNISADLRIADGTLTTTISGVKVDTITDSNIAAGVNATKIGAGTVDNTEFGYLNGVTSSIQSQINAITGSGITSLTGDVSATGPGAAAATVNSVGGSSAANINSAELAANAATSANTASTIVKRDASGNFSANDLTVNLVNGVSVQAHASRHNPGGADALAVAAPVQIGTANFIGAAASYALSDHVHSHGNQTNGSLHAAATTSVNGFMSAADKSKLDTISATAATNAQLLISDGTTYNPQTMSGDATITNTGVISVTSASGDWHKAGNAGTTPGTDFLGTTDAQDLVFKRNSTEVMRLQNNAGSTPALHIGGTGVVPSGILLQVESGVNAKGRSTIQPTSDTQILDLQHFSATPSATSSFVTLYNSAGSTLGLIDYQATVQMGDGVSTQPTFGFRNQSGLGMYRGGSQVLSFATNTAERMRLSSGGNLLIGTASDDGTHKLQVNGTQTVTAIDISGTAGAGFINLPAQSSVPATPASGFNLYSGATGRFVWKGTNGNPAALDATAITGVRIYTMPDASGELALAQMTTAFKTAVVALTDAATIAMDASLGNVFTVTLGGNRTMGTPTNPTNGQKITLRIRQDGTGNRTLTFNSSWNLGVDVQGLPLSTSPNAFDYYGAIYNSVTSKWDIIAMARGY